MLGNQRRPDESCAPNRPALDPAPPTRPVHHAAGVKPPWSGRPATHRGARPATNSTRCARWACSPGSWPPHCRTAPPASRPIWARCIRQVPGAARRSNPDLNAITAANPDLILGSAALTPRPTRSCRRSRRRCSPARRARRGRTTCARRRGDRPRRGRRGSDRGVHRRRPDQTGAAHDATHFQASVVQFTDSTMRVWGARTSRPVFWPPSARIALPRNGSPTSPTSRSASPTPIWTAPRTSRPPTATSSIVSFASPAAKDRAAGRARQRVRGGSCRLPATTGSSSSTTRYGRPAQGVIAARGILDDLHWLNAPIN